MSRGEGSRLEMSETDMDLRLLDKTMVHIEDEGNYVLKGRLPARATWYYSKEKYASRYEAIEAIENQTVTWVKERGEEAEDV